MRVATASIDQTARIWNLEHGREIARLKGHADNVHSADFNQAGDLVATASSDGTVRIWAIARPP
jgi:WD40 repeat protein